MHKWIYNSIIEYNFKHGEYARLIMGTIFLTVICPAIRHLENVNRIQMRLID